MNSIRTRHYFAVSRPLLVYNRRQLIRPFSPSIFHIIIIQAVSLWSVHFIEKAKFLATSIISNEKPHYFAIARRACYAARWLSYYWEYWGKWSIALIAGRFWNGIDYRGRAFAFHTHFRCFSPLFYRQHITVITVIFHAHSKSNTNITPRQHNGFIGADVLERPNIYVIDKNLMKAIIEAEMSVSSWAYKKSRMSWNALLPRLMLIKRLYNIESINKKHMAAIDKIEKMWMPRSCHRLSATFINEILDIIKSGRCWRF